MREPAEQRQQGAWWGDAITVAAIAVVLLYAAAAGYRTLGDSDLPWQLRDARYLLTTGRIASHDVFSYTAAGQPWTYPQLAGLIFYFLYALGGYTALTWLSVAACAATTAAVIAVRPGLLSAALAALAVPLIAWRTAVRADLFTTVLFAVSLLLLLRGAALRRVWLLPLITVLWVNLHTGFIVCFLLIGLFLLSALITRDPAGDNRAVSVNERSQGKAPLPYGRGSVALALAAALSGAVLATLLNPFGLRIWTIFFRQGEGTPFYRQAVSEWGPSVWSWWRFGELLQWRDPDGAYWVLLFISAAAVAAALWKHNWTVPLLIIPFAAASLYSVRFQALLGIAVAAVAARFAPAGNIRRPLRAAALGALVLMAGLRMSDLATNRYYFSHTKYATFGAGLSYILPEKAAQFILQERLPGRLLHEYDLGGYLSWRLGSAYPIFVDGRTLPFGPRLVLENMRAYALPPGSEEWRALMDRWGIRTVILGLERHRQFGAFLRSFCGSAELRLVYLDEMAAVFLRNTPENRPWIDRLGTSCAAATLPDRPANEPAYLYHAQAAEVYRQMGRMDRAWAELRNARGYFTADPDLHVAAGQMLAARDPDAARRELLAATRFPDNSRAWYLLGVLEAGLGRHREAIAAFARSARNEQFPYEAWLAIAKSHLAVDEPRAAARWFERVIGSRDSVAAREALGPAFFADAYAGLARARFLMGDMAGAEAALGAAAAAVPRQPAVRLMLAEFYLGQGRRGEARAALEQAAALGASGPVLDRLREKLDER
jgi:tetratricopeptide (TPR) repeat protein